MSRSSRARATSLFSLIVAGVSGTARADEPAPAPPPAEEAPASPEAPPDAPARPAPEAPKEAPKARLTGTLVGNDTREGLPAATIRITGGPDADQTLATELDGTFGFELAPGTYQLELSTPGYVEQRRTVAVTAGQELQLDLGLDLVVVKSRGETVEVYDTIDTRKASAVLAERRAAATVSDGVSAEQISRSPDSNASDAARRMVAATIQDNRYLVVRGLGGRYSLTLLNGVPLPSPDPDLPATPLDLFPASLITNLTVNKSFAPDLPASFAGGALGIETRNYPARFTFKAKAGVADNTLSSFRTLNGQGGGSLDFLGFDDGTRALPGVIPDDKLAGDPSLSVEQRNAQTAAFNNNWGLQRGTAGPNLNLGASIGDTFAVSGQRLGYFASASLGHGYTHRRSHIARAGESDGMGGKLPSVLQLDDERDTEQANLGAIASVGWTPRPHHKLDLFTMYAHNADISSSQVTGTENNSSVVDRTRLQFLQRELVFAQLIGEDRLAPKAILEWQGNLARVAQHEPDTRDLLRTQLPDGRFAISNGAGASERLFGELSETTLGGGAAVRLPYEAVKLKAGTSLQYGTRAYQQRRFRFDVSGDSVFLPPEQAMSPDNVGLGMSMTEMTGPADGYTAARTVAAAYAMADVNPTRRLRLVGGARFELSNLEVGTNSKIDQMAPPSKPTRHDDRDVLPSLNAVYAVTPSSNLRAAYGITVARPSFREIAPSLFFDYVRRRAVGGNPALERTQIHNGDLRWETFLGDTEVLAASVFAKQFVSPIERTVEGGSDGQSISFANAPSATTYGVELEARVSLGRIAPSLAELSIGGNLSLIGSRIDIGGGATRALQGQSPYVANLGLGYESRRTKTRADLLYNSFGRRIEEVGTGGEGNVYEEPFHRLDL
ncbi:MAG TPA: TonB-dependent receptor, partial [Kofleriaceae bacterium]|nr:TonB-dependent receptor [Kofleriaceae bacterium]